MKRNCTISILFFKWFLITRSQESKQITDVGFLFSKVSFFKYNFKFGDFRNYYLNVIKKKRNKQQIRIY